VEAVPGASALLSALTVSGLDTERVLFFGFLPRKAGARKRVLESQRGRPETIVIFESPRRVSTTLAEVAEILGDRPACLARELTKKHEEVLRDSVSTLAARCAESPPRGECTIVIGGALVEEMAGALAWSEDELEQAIRSELAQGVSTRDLARDLADRSGHARGEIYAKALSLRDPANLTTDEVE
jgi:16S rRNA (cytidine1402-2'-O)-methyltransferase